MKFIALLPLKKNSERVKNKNIKLLNQIPLFLHIAKTLNKTKKFYKLIINTDSKKISEIAKNEFKDWLIIHKRPKYLCGDNISMNKIIKYDIEKFDDNYFFFQTHSTNPFLSAKTIKSAINNFKKNYPSNDSLFSVNSYKSRFYNHKIKAINHNPNFLKNTQDLNNIYEENSCFYIFNKKSFQFNSARIGKKPKIYEMNSLNFENIDIDTISDFELAKKIFKIL